MGKTLVPVTGHWEDWIDEEKERVRKGRAFLGEGGYLLLSYSLLVSSPDPTLSQGKMV